MPERVDGRLTDQDAPTSTAALRRPAPLEDVCPVVKTRELLETVAWRAARRPRRRGAATRSSACREGRDVVVVEGPSDVVPGARASGCPSASSRRCSTRRCCWSTGRERIDFPDEVLGAADCLQRASRRRRVQPRATRRSGESSREHVAPFLEPRASRCFGAIPRDPLLTSVTVARDRRGARRDGARGRGPPRRARSSPSWSARWGRTRRCGSSAARRARPSSPAATARTSSSPRSRPTRARSC